MSKLKSLSKLHQEAIIKAQNETDQNKAAAMAMIEKPIEMIKAIMLKHELAVIEVMRELHEAKDAAVRAEREACAKVCEDSDRHRGEYFAAKIRERGEE
jgi:putative heme iron utilization protein